MVINIDKGIAPPAPKHKHYPFRKMGIGDSFFVETTTRNIMSQAIQFRLRNGLKWKFTVRKEKSGARIWRVE